ncbi:MAG: threonine/serine exporter, partial [Bacteroidota bacterium]|nr:threonine/serine exporter [Bacteroidota bacterium]
MISSSPKISEQVDASEFADLSLDIATTMLASGAHCGRITNNLNRMAKRWQFDVQLQLSFIGVVMNVTSES